MLHKVCHSYISKKVVQFFSMILYLGLFSDSRSTDQGLANSNTSIPFLQKVLSKTGLNPESIEQLLSVETDGNPEVDRKFQNSMWGRPYKPPHILFWNLRSTSGFPTLSLQKNTSMMSGFSPALLNLCCDEGISALQNCTPWSLLVKSLNNPRYKILDDKIRHDLL